MSETATSRAVACLWAALQKPAPAEPQAPSANLVREAIASGWVTYSRVETLLAETDVRPIGSCGLDVREMLAAFEIPLHWTYRRPRRGSDGEIGVEQVTTVDLAHLLILLEAAGFAIDPAPLCEALRPQLRTAEYMTTAGLAAWWYPKERHRCDPKVIATSPRGAWGRWAEDLTTPTGYRAVLFRGPDDEATALEITAPKWRPGRRLAA